MYKGMYIALQLVGVPESSFLHSISLVWCFYSLISLCTRYCCQYTKLWVNLRSKITFWATSKLLCSSRTVPHRRSKIHVQLMMRFRWCTTNYWCAVALVAQLLGFSCCGLVMCTPLQIICAQYLCESWIVVPPLPSSCMFIFLTILVHMCNITISPILFVKFSK